MSVEHQVFRTGPTMIVTVETNVTGGHGYNELNQTALTFVGDSTSNVPSVQEASKDLFERINKHFDTPDQISDI